MVLSYSLSQTGMVSALRTTLTISYPGSFDMTTKKYEAIMLGNQIVPCLFEAVEQ